jgi:hypothetical protein
MMKVSASWSDEDQEWVGTCEEYPSLSWLAGTQDEALKGISELAYATRDDIAADTAEQKKCAALSCPCGCGKIIRYWHGADCDPDTCDTGV